MWCAAVRVCPALRLEGVRGSGYGFRVLGLERKAKGPLRA